MAQEMSGKVVLVTGGNAGIGKATAEELARRGANVTFIARSKNKAEAAKKEIIAASGNGNVDYILADLSEMKQVRAAAEEFKRRHAKLDVLVNNAGVWLPKRELTSEGNEKTFATNYLSHFLLTNRLLDRLKAAAPSRVVNVSSKLTGNIQIPFDDLTLEKNYSVMAAMPVTKLGLLLMTLELSKRLAGTGLTLYDEHQGQLSNPPLYNHNQVIPIYQQLYNLPPSESDLLTEYAPHAPSTGR
jgi:NAD(P)-dependent dehydrogenase (short-subunit alcohol dehydrogenase family)